MRIEEKMSLGHPPFCFELSVYEASSFDRRSSKIRDFVISATPQAAKLVNSLCVFRLLREIRDWRNLEMRRGGGGSGVVVGRGYGLGEGEARGAQQEEEFAGPEQNVQQAAALKIGQALGMQADVEGLSRAFLDEGAHGRQVHGFGGAELTAPRIKAFQLFITTRQEVVQAESLVIQCCNIRAATRTHPAVSTRKHRIHPTQAHGFNSTNGFILLRSTLLTCVTPRKRFHHRFSTPVPPTTPSWPFL